ncbi:hypothetical protein PS1_005239 [Malus domestica]
MDALQLIHFILQTFVDLQYTLKFQHLGFKPIDDSLEVDHLIISSNQLFILCISSETKLRNCKLKILNMRYVTSNLLLCTFMLNLDRVKPSFQVNDWPCNAIARRATLDAGNVLLLDLIKYLRY